MKLFIVRVVTRSLFLQKMQAAHNTPMAIKAYDMLSLLLSSSSPSRRRFADSVEFVVADDDPSSPPSSLVARITIPEIRSKRPK